jgi:hypothetical protein
VFKATACSNETGKFQVVPAIVMIASEQHSPNSNG